MMMRFHKINTRSVLPVDTIQNAGRGEPPDTSQIIPENTDTKPKINVLNQCESDSNGRMMKWQSYNKNIPLLEWTFLENSHLQNTWNYFKKLPEVNVCFRDLRETKNVLWFVIEFPRRKYALFNDKYDVIGLGYLFKRNMLTGQVDFIFHTKYKSGYEKLVHYKDCTYFGSDYDVFLHNHQGNINRVYTSKFIVSNEYQDKAIETGINIYRHTHKGFYVIVHKANDFIQEAKIICRCIPQAVKAYPLLISRQIKALCEGKEDSMEEASRDIIPNEPNNDSCLTAELSPIAEVIPADNDDGDIHGVEDSYSGTV